MKRSEFGNSKRGRFKTFVGLLLVIVAVWRLFCIGMDYREGEETYRKLEQAVSIHSEIRKESVQAEDTADTQETQDRGQAEKAAFDFSSIEIDFSYLQSLNEDIIGWLLFDYNGISYPVLQGEDNSYYLNRTRKKEKSAVGSIFLECEVSRDLSDFNTIIYGHKMRNGSMFGSLEKYKEESYWRDHPSVYLVSAEGVRRYDVYAAYEAGVRDITYGLKIKDQEKKEELIRFGKDQSDIDTGIEPTADDRILTLSTCTGRGYRTRWVVQAVEYRENQ